MTTPRRAIGIIHPGEMGSAVGAALVAGGLDVLWASEGRSSATADRASSGGFTRVDTIDRLVDSSDVILSVCPPHAALAVADEVVASSGPGAGRLYVDANAIAPASAEQVAATVEGAGFRYVDGGIIGPPPLHPGTTRMYLSGAAAGELTETFATPLIELHVVSDRPGDASALKLSYAAWTKGSAALLLAVRAAALRAGVEDALLVEWRTSLPDLSDRHESAQRAAATKGWRWSGEMDEIAAMFEALGLPTGFHQAAAEVYRSHPV